MCARNFVRWDFDLTQLYFAAFFFLFFLERARRSTFFRRRARFFTLSLPWLCPIAINTHPLCVGSQAFSLLADRKKRHRTGLMIADNLKWQRAFELI